MKASRKLPNFISGIQILQQYADRRRGHCPKRALIVTTADVCEQSASKSSLLKSSTFHFSEISNPPTFGGTVIPLWQHQSTQHKHSNFKKISVVEAKLQQAEAMIRDEDEIHHKKAVKLMFYMYESKVSPETFV